MVTDSRLYFAVSFPVCSKKGRGPALLILPRASVSYTAFNLNQP